MAPLLRPTTASAEHRSEPAAGWAEPGECVHPAALAAITQLYRRVMPNGGAILDLMSGWVSHLPPEIPYRRIVGLGSEACELAENPFLDEWRVQDLNRDPRLPFAAAEFDAAALCASVQHLTRPFEVIRDVGRVLKPGAPLVVTFSSCCRAIEPIACWRLLDDAGHLCLVARYFAEAGNWTGIRCLDLTPGDGRDPLYAVLGRSLGPAASGTAD
ncbi:MAG: methyltransferase domain-containing protein [Alphaproteobacteria bacterium]|nr:methyltransferase domain-containing protein [Alphaproteobacteria bacterium]MBV9862891.1 methyltransferase domain-containing protein [Alphaproteobacteria bacterium]